MHLRENFLTCRLYQKIKEFVLSCSVEQSVHQEYFIFSKRNCLLGKQMIFFVCLCCLVDITAKQMGMYLHPKRHA